MLYSLYFCYVAKAFYLLYQTNLLFQLMLSKCVCEIINRPKIPYCEIFDTGSIAVWFKITSSKILHFIADGRSCTSKNVNNIYIKLQTDQSR